MKMPFNVVISACINPSTTFLKKVMLWTPLNKINIFFLVKYFRSNFLQ